MSWVESGSAETERFEQEGITIMTDADYEFGNAGQGRQVPDNRADYRLTATARATLELESTMRSEERRVGKECIARGSRSQ